MAARRAKRTEKIHKSHDLLKRIFLVSVLVLCTIIVIGIGVIIGMYASSVKEIHAMNVQNLALNYSSTIYYTDEDGNAHELENIYNNGNRIWLDSEEIPKIMKEAMVAIEDERFYEHNGIDIKRTTGAFFGWVKAKLTGGKTSYGGSTITQQVIKNITQQKNKTAARKVKEMLLAVALEKELSKDEILTIYLNIVCFANNCYGVEAAANIYYDKSAMELTLNEAATIAGITQRPEYYNPLKNPENAKYKRDVVLTKMCDVGMISIAERDDTIEKGLELNDRYNEMRSKVSSYFTDELLNEIIEDLQKEKGYSAEMAEQLVYSGGLSIYATVDPEIQSKMEKFYENKDNFPKIKKEAQSAMIVIDPYTGGIKGVIGGLGEKTASRGLNRATQSTLQPGSAIKPLSVYAPLLEEDLINQTTKVLDAELTIGDWSPENSYSGYKGTMTAKRAVQISANTPAVRLLQELTIGKSYKYLQNVFGITSLSNTDKNLSSLALGGLTDGITPKEMAAAYAVFANGGIYIEPHSYTKVVDNSGKVLLEKYIKPKRVLRESTAFIMTNMLKDVVNTSSGTGKLAKVSNMPTYGKTGTTNETKDKWFVGFTPYYVGAVWYGFDKPDSINKYGVRYNISAKVWGAVMSDIHRDLDRKDFEAPDSVIKKGNDYFWEKSKLKITSTIDEDKKDEDQTDEDQTVTENEEGTKPEEGKENGENKEDTPIDIPTEEKPSEDKKPEAPPSDEGLPPTEEKPSEPEPSDDGIISLD